MKKKSPELIRGLTRPPISGNHLVVLLFLEDDGSPLVWLVVCASTRATPVVERAPDCRRRFRVPSLSTGTAHFGHITTLSTRVWGGVK